MLNDAQLASKAASGDDEAFTELVTRYRKYVYTIAYKISLNEEDAMDITQNTFIRLLKKISAYDPNRPFRPWLAVLTSRVSLNYMARSKSREIPTDPGDFDELMTSQNGLEANKAQANLDIEDKRKLVAEAMKGIQPQQRTILALNLTEGLKPKEISKQLGIPARQVSTQLSRAISKIREVLSVQENTSKSKRFSDEN